MFHICEVMNAYIQLILTETQRLEVWRHWRQEEGQIRQRLSLVCVNGAQRARGAPLHRPGCTPLPTEQGALQAHRYCNKWAQRKQHFFFGQPGIPDKRKLIRLFQRETLSNLKAVPTYLSPWPTAPHSGPPLTKASPENPPSGYPDINNSHQGWSSHLLILTWLYITFVSPFPTSS